MVASCMRRSGGEPSLGERKKNTEILRGKHAHGATENSVPTVPPGQTGSSKKQRIDVNIPDKRFGRYRTG